MHLVVKKLLSRGLLCSSILLVGCTSWIYRIDIPQGNYVEQKQVDKIRVAMSREQILFIMGSPVASNVFDDDQWHYLYLLNKNKTKLQRLELIVHFADDKVSELSGTFKKPEDFDIPLEQ
ncbi:MAG: outer membrane protein assembly factor BamE [Phenylobacterium sp.]|jgi:outer membrane protein assembly factor BamE